MSPTVASQGALTGLTVSCSTFS
uniref:Uncharacterized protein n=1 Tax=Arundo donax TaxID=35708 RepID=A0A0A8YRY4_ARUDO